MGIIGEIEKAIKALARTQPVKEKICEYIQQEVRIMLQYYMFRDGLNKLCSLGVSEIHDRGHERCRGSGELRKSACTLQSHANHS